MAFKSHRRGQGQEMPFKGMTQWTISLSLGSTSTISLPPSSIFIFSIYQ
jgi:hypothetical protein